MPRPVAPPRLYLHKRRDGAAQWIILDAGRQVATGASEGDRRKAEKALEAYLGRMILRLQWMPNTTGGWVDLKAVVRAGLLAHDQAHSKRK